MLSVYTLEDPGTGDPFYVGSTKKPLPLRLADHLKDAFYAKGANGKQKRIREMLEDGVTPTIRLLEQTDDPSREQWHIDHLTGEGAVLLNRYCERQRRLSPVAPNAAPTEEQEYDEQRALQTAMETSLSSYVTVQEAAAWHGVTRQAIVRALAEGRLKGLKHGRHWLIAASDMRAYNPLPVTGRGKRRPGAT